MVDPKRHHFFGFPGATLFKPNAKELADALGEPIRPDDAAWMESVRARLRQDIGNRPRDTRNVLGFTLSICREADARTLRPVQFGVARP